MLIRKVFGGGDHKTVIIALAEHALVSARDGQDEVWMNV